MYLIAQRKVRTFTGMVGGFKVFEFARSLNLKAMDYEINPEIIYKALILRASMAEIPAHLDWEWQNSFAKKSLRVADAKGNIFRLMSGFIFRPYIFFLTVGIVTFLLFAYMFVWLTIHIVQSYPIISSTGTYFDDHFFDGCRACVWKLATPVFCFQVHIDCFCSSLSVWGLYHCKTSATFFLKKDFTSVHLFWKVKGAVKQVFATLGHCSLYTIGCHFHQELVSIRYFHPIHSSKWYSQLHIYQLLPWSYGDPSLFPHKP